MNIYSQHIIHYVVVGKFLYGNKTNKKLHFISQFGQEKKTQPNI